MKKYSALFLLLFVVVQCKEKASSPEGSSLSGLHYAKYRIQVNKDPELKTWAATLEKAEAVTVVETTLQKDSKQKEFTLCKISLADGLTGYIDARHLAGPPVVFTEPADAYSRPDLLSKIHTKLPPGTIGFITGENGTWTNIYAGKINDVWITDHWVESTTYSTDIMVVVDAKKYEAALDLLSQSKKDEAITQLKTIEEGANSELFKNIARQKLQTLDVDSIPDSGDTSDQMEP